MKGETAPSWPRVIAGTCEAAPEAVDRGKRRPAIELRNHPSGMPTWWSEGEGNTVRWRNTASRPQVPRSLRPCACVETLYLAGRGDIMASDRKSIVRAVGEGLWPQARYARYGEVRHRRSTKERAEQSCIVGDGGGSGGKAGDQGELL